VVAAPGSLAVINGSWYIQGRLRWARRPVASVFRFGSGPAASVHRSWFGLSPSVRHERFQTWQQLDLFQRIRRRPVLRQERQGQMEMASDRQQQLSCPPWRREHWSYTDRGKRASKLQLLVAKRGAPLAAFISGATGTIRLLPLAWSSP